MNAYTKIVRFPIKKGEFMFLNEPHLVDQFTVHDVWVEADYLVVMFSASKAHPEVAAMMDRQICFFVIPQLELEEPLNWEDYVPEVLKDHDMERVAYVDSVRNHKDVLHSVFFCEFFKEMIGFDVLYEGVNPNVSRN